MTARNRRIAAWVFLVLLNAALFFRVQHSIDSQCESSNQARATLRHLAVQIVDQDGVRSEGERQSLRLVNENLAPRDCSGNWW